MNLTKKRNLLIVCIVIGSFVVRMYKLDGPLTDGHAYRQTQTALTVKSFCETGVNLLDYQTPIFTPPWKEPFEFPFYQYTAYLVHKMGVDNIDLACRIANLIYFYLAAIFVWLIAQKLFRNKKLSLLTLFLYLFIPFGIQWSRTAMIEFAAVFFTLAYVYSFWKWIEKPRKILFVLTGVVAGGLAASIKLPTLYAGVMFLVPLVLYRIARFWEKDQILSRLRFNKEMPQTIAYILAFSLLCIIPLVLGLLWLNHAEQIKMANDLQFYTLEKTRVWNFGTVLQRFSFGAWAKFGSHLYNLIPGVILPIIIFAFAKLFYLNKLKSNHRNYFLMPLLAVIATPLTFFNLYVVHNYYLCAIYPFYILCLAFVLYFIYKKYMTQTLYKRCYIGLCLLSFTLTPSMYRYVTKTNYDNDSYVEIGKHINQISKPEEFIVVEDNTSHPALLYYSDRKGFISSGISDEYARVLRKHAFHYFVSPSPEASLTVLKKYFEITEMEPFESYRIFRMDMVSEQD